jgi:hypothetical protein
MSGDIEVGFSTQAIIESKRKIQRATVIASSSIFFLGLLISLWLARNIPSLCALFAMQPDGLDEGDLTANIQRITNDEIGRPVESI